MQGDEMNMARMQTLKMGHGNDSQILNISSN